MKIGKEIGNTNNMMFSYVWDYWFVSLRDKIGYDNLINHELDYDQFNIEKVIILDAIS